MPVYLNIILIFVLFFFNAIFAMYEIAMVSARRTRLHQRAEDGQHGAAVALKLQNDPNQEYLSAVQIMITLIDTLAGGIGGGMLAAPLADVLRRVSFLAPIADTLAFISVVVMITYFSIVLGELIPKRIAVSKPENVVTQLSPIINGLTVALTPLIRLLSASTNLGIKVFNIDITKEPYITEEELKGYIQEGRQTGVFDEAEEVMVDGVFRFSERRVDAIMTPHTELDWLDLNDGREVMVREMLESPYSRLPVAEGDLDRIIGIVNAKDLMGVNLFSEDFDIRDYVKVPMFFPGNMKAVKAFEDFRSTGIHQAIVMDEFGGVEGMVTLYDVLESIVGDIPQDEFDTEVEIEEQIDGSLLVDGLLPIDVVKDKLNVEYLPEEFKAGYQTLSGFVMNQMGKIPRVGQGFEWEGFTFKVVEMDGHRVERVQISKTSG
ncbi:MAG: hemolysin family protein [Anaerolineaceae bacterium]|mgnify:CR=1 FL=1|jgi:putative hemolysin|nr:hemolysin family protein [Anaerolineaceae bacterium]MDD4043567.1 hemolysin family protein [Anaerolineaceae bacterium]MDD4578209.1 hemolysin family protein [Anaerolineaceae bacterium]